EKDQEQREVRTSNDPNEKLGAPGFGAAQFVLGNELLPYVIYFENAPTASAPAQEADVTDDLDSDLDPMSVQLGEIAFGSQVVDGLIGQSQGSVTVPLPNSGLTVNVSVQLANGQLQWKLKTIDPKTGDLVGDPAAGF